MFTGSGAEKLAMAASKTLEKGVSGQMPKKPIPDKHVSSKLPKATRAENRRGKQEIKQLDAFCLLMYD